MSLMIRFGTLGGLLAIGAACASTGGSGRPEASSAPAPASPAATSAAPLTFRQTIAPFPISDSTGRLLEMAFLGGFNTPRPQLVDADGDGDLDLFVQEVNNKIGYYERDGERDGLPRFVFKSEKYGDINPGQWFRFADVDRDGDLDLLTEQPFSYIKYWKNDGGTGALHFSVGADTLRDPNGTALFADAQNIAQLGDLDCNQRADLLIGRLDGTVSRYEATENTSNSGGAPMFQLVTNEFEGIKIVGEGQVGGAGGPLMPGGGAQPNQGGEPSQPNTPRKGGPLGPQGSSKHGANTMALADHDKDGDLDLFWGDYFEPGLLLIENTGTCQKPNFRNTPVRFPLAAPFLTSGYNAPTFGDVSGDGNVDLVMGVLGGAYNPLLTSVDNLYYNEQAADRSWIVKSRHLLPVMDIGSETIPSIVDIDGDGDLDLLLANRIDPNNLKLSRISWFENTGTAAKPVLKQKPTWLPIPPAARDLYHLAPTFGDVDGDGKLDLFLGDWGLGGKASVAWYKIGAGASTITMVDSAVITISRGSNTVPTLGDIDGDGDLDLLVGEASGWINHYRNEGTAAKPKFVLVTEEFDSIKVGRRSAPHLIDIDKDGDLDLLVGSESSGVALFRNVGSRTVARFERDTAFATPTQSMSVPATGDLDGDGDVDLIIGGAGGGALYLEQQ